jgi:AraC family transcriptional activator of pobA
MPKEKHIPVYDLCSIQTVPDKLQDDLIIEPFGSYLEKRPGLFIPHRHSFYHIVYFTRGSGKHTIDFEQFEVSKGQIYFMVPGQVHSWQFKGEIDGFVLNFSEHFIHAFVRNDQYLEQFPFLDGIASNAVINLKGKAQEQAAELMKKMLAEVRAGDTFHRDMIRVMLLELFMLTARATEQDMHSGARQHHVLTLRNFRKLVEQHFNTLRLPKEYAAMLYITPNHLNALSKDILGKPAGAIIRDRILLEAKRLLTNGNLSIGEIAYQLNFEDNSYFTKFFKKLTGSTPETFRKGLAINTQK